RHGLQTREKQMTRVNRRFHKLHTGSLTHRRKELPIFSPQGKRDSHENSPFVMTGVPYSSGATSMMITTRAKPSPLLPCTFSTCRDHAHATSSRSSRAT